MIQLITTQIQGVGNSIWASLGELYHSKDYDKFNHHVVLISKIIATFSFAILFPLCFLNQSFISLWVGTDLFAGLLFTVVACTNAYFTAVLTFWGWLFSSAAKIDQISKLSLYNAFINITLSFLFTKWLGVIGPILGTFVANLLFAYVAVLLKTNRCFNIPRRLLVSSSLSPLAWIIVLGPVFYYGRHALENLSWFYFIAMSVLFYIIFLPFCFFFILRRHERLYFYYKFRFVLKK